MSTPKRARIADVAARANVSLITASRALTNPAHVAAETRHRVRQAAQELGYLPNRMARGLRNGKTQTIAVVATNIQQRLNTQKVDCLQRELVRSGYHTFLVVHNEFEEGTASLAALCRGSVDGAVLCCLDGGPSVAEVKELLALGVPVVSLEHFADCAMDIVTTDREYGARLAVEHLCGAGHARIGLALLAMNSEVIERRIVGYKQAMREAGLEPLVVFQNSGDSSLFEDGYRLIVENCREGLRPTAWIFPDDEMAVGALRALRELGLRVPEDVTVIGWDNSPLCDYVQPRLTSIAQPVEEVVRLALERLLARIGGDDRAPERTLIRPTLVVRESCGDGKLPSLRMETRKLGN